MRLDNGEVLLRWPLALHVITAGFYYNDGKPHNAIDLRTNQGGVTKKPVYAAEDGTVDQTQTWDGHTTTGMQSYGTMVRLRHADYAGCTLQTRYAHLSELCVSYGQQVKEGDLIGYTGQTGNVYGAHLHFEVILGGTRVNPLNWLDSDFSCASDAVLAHLGNYISVQRPTEEPATPTDTRLQIVTIGPVTQGNADAILAVCELRGLTAQGLYTSKWANDAHTMQTITVGPVSRGDADAMLICAVGRGLTDAGLYKSEWA